MPYIVYIACSMDGFIAKPDGDVDWLINIPNEQNSDYGFEEFMGRIDGILMGRKSFEKIMEFKTWPYSKPVFVLSNTLKEIKGELEGRAEIISGDVGSATAMLQKKNIRNVYVDGGKTIQSFLEKDLIDEMIITTASVILGSGIPLFGFNPEEKKFRIMKTERLNDYLVKNYFYRDRS